MARRTPAREILELHRRYLLAAAHPRNGDDAPVVERAKGHTVWDAEGKAYLDFFGSDLNVSVGHANAEVDGRVMEQLGRLQHVPPLYPNEVTARLAEKIASKTPGGLQKCLFTSSGSEANETALAAARLATGNRAIVALRHARAGSTLKASSFAAHGSGWLGGSDDGAVLHVRSPYLDRATTGFGEDRLMELCVKDVEETLETATEGRIAAFIAEPLLGAGGFEVLPRGYLRRVAPLVRAAGGLMIVDETQTGWARAGKHWCAVEHWGIAPDIMTFAKGMANGAPIGCTVATPEVADALEGATFSTTGGSLLSMAAALATFGILERHDLPDNAYRQGLRLRSRLGDATAPFAFVGSVRGMGLLQALEIVVPDGAKKPDPARAQALVTVARRHGLLVGAGGLEPHMVRVAPHLTVDAKEIDDGVERLARALNDVAG